ncbi:hypothetical protein niasHS_007966 [Heterodera schachtii]|uniref:Peptidase C1A papain C-terminal domain-containing protein n=1 Tax=Heterodera schachtii TaxID=97005 RepID=A0ABD2JQ56_HETSC
MEMACRDGRRHWHKLLNGLGMQAVHLSTNPRIACESHWLSKAVRQAIAVQLQRGQSVQTERRMTHWEGADENRVEEMMREIMTNVPIEVTTDWYKDAYLYGQSSTRVNVYMHAIVNGTTNSPEHKTDSQKSLKLIGWGEESTDKGEVVKYWLGVNTLGIEWGLNGFVKWRRGTDECRIESFDTNFGTPRCLRRLNDLR